jgi:hypothetical protein
MTALLWGPGFMFSPFHARVMFMQVEVNGRVQVPSFSVFARTVWCTANAATTQIRS